MTFEPLATGVLTAGSVRSTVLAAISAFGSVVHRDLERVWLRLEQRLGCLGCLPGDVGNGDLIRCLRDREDDDGALHRRLTEWRVGAQHLAGLERGPLDEHRVGSRP